MKLLPLHCMYVELIMKTIMTIVKDSKNMKSSIKKTQTANIRYAIPLLLLASSVTWSEISSLSSEELTDTYIKDTTVIVRQQKTDKSSVSVPVQLKVTPLEEATQVLPQDQVHTTSAISHELSNYDDLNKQRALDSNLAPQLPLATTQFLKAPPSEAAIQAIRRKYGAEQGVIPGQSFDLTTLPFLTDLRPSDISVGADTYEITDNSFTIRIPNLGNFNSQQISSPNGEIGVNVTPSHIEYTLNLPK